MFMLDTIMKDMVVQPGTKFVNLKDDETIDVPRVFKEKRRSVQDY